MCQEVDEIHVLFVFEVLFLLQVDYGLWNQVQMKLETYTVVVCILRALFNLGVW
jgi:hypothetical protein